MNVIDTHRIALKWAFDLLGMVTADLTQELADWRPPGIANPIGAQYAHAVCSADAVIHTVLQGKPALFDTAWANKSGVSQPQMQATAEWSRSVWVDLPALGSYAQAVFNASDAYLASLTVEDLSKDHDLTGAGLGIHNSDWILSALVTSHLNNMAGEISCLKGLQGMQGYPF
jgi:hypothetical protein